MFRKRRRPETCSVSKCQNEEEEDEEKVVQHQLQKIREIQGLRKRVRGLPAEVSEKVDENNVIEVEEATQGGLLDRQFIKKQESITAFQNSHLEEYIQKRLAEKNKSAQSAPSNIESDSKPKSKFDVSELYAIPKHLQVADTISAQADKMNWVTGLVEVPISLEKRLENIELTERAKRKLLKMGTLDSKNEATPEEDVVTKAFGTRFQSFDRDIPRGKASDKLALDNFQDQLQD